MNDSSSLVPCPPNHNRILPAILCSTEETYSTLSNSSLAGIWEELFPFSARSPWKEYNLNTIRAKSDEFPAPSSSLLAGAAFVRFTLDGGASSK